MSVRIVNSLKAIQIGHGYPNGEVMSGGRTQLATHPEINRATVMEAGQGICQREFLQLTVLGLYLAVELNDPTTDSDACHEFTRMEGLREIVICSGCQSFDDLLFVRMAGKKDQVRVGLVKIPSYRLAQLKTTNVRHCPVCNDNSRLMLGEAIKRLAIVFRKNYGVRLVGERLLDKLAIDGRIIDDQDFEFLAGIRRRTPSL